MIEIWTDGACEPNPGLGGWAYTMNRPDGCCVEDCGGEIQTTNNRMELMGILMALKSLPDGAVAVVYSDSQYAVKGLTIWHPKWLKRNWNKKDGAPMPNRDLWMALEAQTKRLSCKFAWVRGHNGNRGNERADALAAKGRQKAIEAQEMEDSASLDEPGKEAMAHLRSILTAWEPTNVAG